MVQISALDPCAPGNDEFYQRQLFAKNLDSHVVHAAGKVHVRLLGTCHLAPHDVEPAVSIIVWGHAVRHELGCIIRGMECQRYDNIEITALELDMFAKHSKAVQKMTPRKSIQGQTHLRPCRKD